MTGHRTGKLRPLAWIAFFGGMLVGVPAMTADSDCPGMEDFVKVKVTIGTNSITVDPEVVTIYRSGSRGQPARVCWHVDQPLGLQRQLHIGTAKNTPELFTRFGRMHRKFGGTSKRHVGSGTPNKNGEWTYKLWVTQGGREVIGVDPRVIIKDTPGRP